MSSSSQPTQPTPCPAPFTGAGLRGARKPKNTKNTMITNLDQLTGSAPLYRRYPSQSNPQNAFVKIDSDGDIWYYTDPEVGNGIPSDIFHNVARRWCIPNDLTARGYEGLHEDIQELLQRVADGMTTRWNGNNTVGRLTEDAADARDELEQYLADCWRGDYERDEEYLAELESA
jgi:hypothetical protein